MHKWNELHINLAFSLEDIEDEEKLFTCFTQALFTSRFDLRVERNRMAVGMYDSEKLQSSGTTLAFVDEDDSILINVGYGEFNPPVMRSMIEPLESVVNPLLLNLDHVRIFKLGLSVPNEKLETSSGLLQAVLHLESEGSNAGCKRLLELDRSNSESVEFNYRRKEQHKAPSPQASLASILDTLLAEARWLFSSGVLSAKKWLVELPAFPASGDKDLVRLLNSKNCPGSSLIN